MTDFAVSSAVSFAATFALSFAPTFRLSFPATLFTKLFTPPAFFAAWDSCFVPLTALAPHIIALPADVSAPSILPCATYTAVLVTFAAHEP